MIFRLFILLIGFGLAVVDGVTLIAYLNLITTGHGLIEYLQFIMTKPDPYLFLFGNFLIWGSIYLPLNKK